MSRLLREKAPLQVRLDSGLAVTLRPISGEDYDRVKRAYNLLSEESRMNRFWEKPREMSPSRAASLTDTDNDDHVAWVALRSEDITFPGYAGASWWRDGDDSTRAELAFTVADDWQRQGLASLLFSILWHDGWHSGVREFYGYCRAENHAMTGWWKDIGGIVEIGSRQAELRLPLESPKDFVGRVGYEMPPSRRRVAVTEWMSEWLDAASEKGV